MTSVCLIVVLQGQTGMKRGDDAQKWLVLQAIDSTNALRAVCQCMQGR